MSGVLIYGRYIPIRVTLEHNILVARRPLISVVIPAYNAGPFIAETLESVLSQTYSHREIIVVDDGSTDDTEQVVQPYLGRTRFIRQKNTGEGGARNAGLRAATGDYIAFLDADDLWLPEKLEVQLQVAGRHPESSLIVCDGIGFDGDRVVTDRLLKGELASRLDLASTGELTGNVYRELIARNAITCPAQTLIPRAVAERVGFVMEHRQASIDWEYNLRIARDGPVTLHRHSLVRYRLLPTSVSGPPQLRGFINTFKDIPILRQETQRCAVEDRPWIRRNLRRRAREQARNAYNYARKQDVAYARASLLKLFRAVPEEPMTLFWLLATRIPERAISAVVALGRRVGVFRR
jgi:glycosyltransferase involved in cell wall biosynthesis